MNVRIKGFCSALLRSRCGEITEIKLITEKREYAISLTTPTRPWVVGL